MAGYRFDPESSSLDCRGLSSEIAHLLDDAQIPNVIWNWMLLNLHGVPTTTNGPEFIVPDHLIQAAYTTLLNAGFFACRGNKFCRQCKRNRISPAPDEHLHLSREQQDPVLALYKKSKYIWALPELELGLPTPDDPNFILVSDERLPPAAIRGGCGPWPSSSYPVKALTAPRLTEALILLLCRDQGINTHDAFWIVNLTYMSEYVRGRGRMKNEELHPKFLPMWESSCLQWTYKIRDLREKLIENNELPAPLYGGRYRPGR